MRKEDIKLIDFTALGINTSLFSPAAEYFKKFSRYPDFNDFDYWDEEQRRCIDGFKITGSTGITIGITGEHYQYLNYTKIKLTEDPDKNKVKKFLFRKAVTKGYNFPDFWDGDYIFYWCKIIARFGASDHPDVKKAGGLTLQEFENLHFPDEVRIKPYYFEDDGVKYTIYGSGKNMVVGKKRRGGYSYKMATSGARRYHFFKKATTLLCAYDNAYLLDDALMTKTVESIDWIDKHTPFQKRRLINLDDHKQCGWKENVNGTEVFQGRLSQLMAVSFRGNKGAARGKDADEIYVEESGKAPNLIEFTDATIDTLSDGLGNSTGQIIWFGTGGGDNTDWEGFEQIFFNPEKYNCLEFENVWDEGASGSYCGMFIPDYWTAVGSITENGESLIAIAREAEEEYQYNTYIVKGDSIGLTKRKMEHPFCPMDAFAISSSNIFDVASLKEHKQYVERNGLHNLANKGNLVRDVNGKLKFNLNSDLQPVWEYPIKKKDNTGCLVMWESPYKNNDAVPANMYIIDVDTYRHAETTGSSVGAIYVYMQPNNIHFSGGDKLVACYVGRPKEPEDFVKVIFELAEFYNAKIGFENDEPGGVVEYAKTHRLLHRLEEQFELAFEEKVKTKEGMNRKFGMHMGSGKDNLRIEYGDGYLKTWLESPRRIDENGNITYNYQTIYDIGLLEELIRYNPDNVKKKKGNYDRISAMRVLMYHRKEAVYKNIKVSLQQKQTGFFATRLFK